MGRVRAGFWHVAGQCRIQPVQNVGRGLIADRTVKPKQARLQIGRPVTDHATGGPDVKAKPAQGRTAAGAIDLQICPARNPVEPALERRVAARCRWCAQPEGQIEHRVLPACHVQHPGRTSRRGGHGRAGRDGIFGP